MVARGWAYLRNLSIALPSGKQFRSRPPNGRRGLPHRRSSRFTVRRIVVSPLSSRRTPGPYRGVSRWLTFCVPTSACGYGSRLALRLAGTTAGSDAALSSRGTECPSHARLVHPRKTEGTGKTGCWLTPMARLQKDKQAAVTTGPNRINRPSLREWLTAYTCSPRCAGLVGHRHRRDALASRSDVEKHHRQLDISVGISGPHDFAVRAGLHSSMQPSRPSHPALHVS